MENEAKPNIEKNEAENEEDTEDVDLTLLEKEGLRVSVDAGVLHDLAMTLQEVVDVFENLKQASLDEAPQDVCLQLQKQFEELLFEAHDWCLEMAREGIRMLG